MDVKPLIQLTAHLIKSDQLKLEDILVRPIHPPLRVSLLVFRNLKSLTQLQIQLTKQEEKLLIHWQISTC